jgi:polysaccharide export outer membrane protein
VAAAPSAANAGAGDYRLAARDLVQFQISDEPEPPAVQRVSASGEIAVPLLGPVRVGGLTLREAEQMLSRQYVERGFFVKPQVILSLQTYAPRSVSVLGQVNRPDQIEFPVECEQMSLVQAITAAGGFTRIARTDAVRINRRSGEHDRSITVNVDLLLGAKTPAEAADFQLLAGDVVFVPERTF